MLIRMLIIKLIFIINIRLKACSLRVTGTETHFLPKTIFTSRLIWYNSSAKLIGKKVLFKKFHELVYEKCQMLFILLQLCSCSLN